MPVNREEVEEEEEVSRSHLSITRSRRRWSRSRLSIMRRRTKRRSVGHACQS